MVVKVLVASKLELLYYNNLPTEVQFQKEEVPFQICTSDILPY